MESQDDLTVEIVIRRKAEVLCRVLGSATRQHIWRVPFPYLTITRETQYLAGYLYEPMILGEQMLHPGSATA